MIIVEKIKKLVQTKEEPITITQRGVKYEKVENGWIPILNEPTISLIDLSEKIGKSKKTQIEVVN